MKLKSRRTGRIITYGFFENNLHHFTWDDAPETICYWDDIRCDEKFHGYFINL